jgi:hypothetical protein
MDNREHEFRMSFDPEYSDRQEFIQAWVKDHAESWHVIFRENWVIVFVPLWFLFLFTKNIVVLSPFIGYFASCFLVAMDGKRRQKRIAEWIWRWGDEQR